jgi:hypothetical protein
VGKWLAVTCVASIAFVVLSAEAAAKQLVAVEYGHVGKPMKIGPYVVTVDGVATAAVQDGRAVASITFAIRNTSRKVLSMPGAVTACAGADELAGTSLVADPSRPSSLPPRHTRRHVLYRFQPSTTGCAAPEIRLGLDFPGNGRFTQLRIPAGRA